MKKLSLRVKLTLIIGIIVFLNSAFICVFTADKAKNSIDYAVYLTDMSFQENNYADFAVAVARDDENTAAAKSVEVTPTSQDINQLIKELYVYDFLISFLASGLAMLIAYTLVGMALKPLNEIGDKMLCISAGNLDDKLEGYDDNNEIGNLAYAFNQMLAKLQASFLRQKRFSTSVAHELKNPLTIMKTAYQVLDDNDDLTDYQQAVAINKKNIDRLIATCNDLLEYANDGDFNMNEIINVAKIFDDIVKELEPMIVLKSLKVVKDLDDTIVIMGNHQLVYRMFYNLIENAIKYGKQQGHIYLICQKDFKTIVITIADDGVGIAKKNLPYIFEPFYQINNANQTTAGSGIGLALVKNVVEKHGWELQVISELGKKTQFIIEI